MKQTTKVRPPSPSEQHKETYHRENKDLSTPDLNQRLIFLTRQAERNNALLIRLASELREAKIEEGILNRCQEVLLNLIMGRQ